MRFRKLCFGQIGKSETVNYAVEELKRYVKAIDREVMVEVVLADKPINAAYNVIWVGIHEDLQANVPAVADPEMDDAIAISVENGKGYISGSNERSVLIAAYRFLRELGCDWVRPGDDGFRVTKHPLENVCVSCFEAASSRYRGICMEGTIAYQHVIDLIEYMPKVGMNEYFVQFFLPATFFENWSSHSRNRYIEEETKLTEELMGAMVLKIEQELAKRRIRYHKVGHGWTAKPFGMNTSGWYREKVHVVPEEAKPYLAMIDGVRGLKNNSPMDTQLCYSNPIARTKIVDCVVAYAKENPHIDFLHVWDGDNLHNHCECEECRKKRPSDWLVMMLNDIDAELTKKGMDNMVNISFYIDAMFAPTVEKLNNPNRFMLTFCPISRNYNESITTLDNLPEPIPYVRNKWKAPKTMPELYALLKEWQNVFDGSVTAFEYHFWRHQYRDPGLAAMSRRVYEDVLSYKPTGMDGCMQDGSNKSFFPHGFHGHIYAEALMNRDCDYEAELADYFSHFYGENWQVVRQYLDNITTAFDHDYMCGTKSVDMKKGMFYNPAHAASLENVKELAAGMRAFIQENAPKKPTRPQAAAWKILLRHTAFCEGFAAVLSEKCKGHTKYAMELFEAFKNDFGKYDLELERWLDYTCCMQSLYVMTKNLPKIEL